MRVLAVTTWLPTPSHPSVGAFVVQDATAIAGLGHDVHLVHLVPPHQLDPAERRWGPARTSVGDLPVTRIPMSTTRPGQLGAAGRQLRAMAAHADVVHTMAFSALLPLAWWRPEAPWVHTEHWSGLTAPQTLPRSWRLALPALKRLFSRPDVVTAVCDYLADPIREVRGERPTRVVPCIVPVPEPVPARPPERGDVAMVDIGALIERKDPLLAVDVVAELRGRGIPATLALVGQGDLRGRVERRVRDLDLTDAVRLTGPLDRVAVLTELARADLFLGPTRGDNFFVSCAEALVSGRPVVVGATGGQGEYIAPQAGETVPEQTPVAYADAVQRVLARAQGLTAQDIADTIGQRFSVDAVAQGYQAAYDLAVATRGSPP